MSGKYLHQRPSWVYAGETYIYNHFYETYLILHFNRNEKENSGQIYQTRALTVFI